MITDQSITLSRPCEAVLIPGGNTVQLPAGSSVRIMQALGGTYTVVTEGGEMVRIAGHDVDALGLQVAAESTRQTIPGEQITAEQLEKLVWEQLQTCYDPEIPASIVELGLVYLCRVRPLEEGGHQLEVQFTLTAPGCGMGDVLKSDIQKKVTGLPGVKRAEVSVVLEPPWTPDKMSDAARLQLGMM